MPLARINVNDVGRQASHMPLPKVCARWKSELWLPPIISLVVGRTRAATSLYPFLAWPHLQEAKSHDSDSANARALTSDYYADGSKMTDESCIAYCSGKKYAIAGTEYSQECYCGNALVGGSVAAPAGDCNMGCSGNSSEACGGPSRLTVFENPALIPVHDPGPNGWTLIGCYT